MRDDAILLDLDGTLVDSVYHHVMAWDGALRAAGYAMPLWRIHNAIGMGSDRLVPWLLGRHVEEAKALSNDHRRRFLDAADDLKPTRGAAELLDDLTTRGVAFIISTSAAEEERQVMLGILDAEELGASGAEDVGSSKPAPDLLLDACKQLDANPARTTLVGDSPWDAVAATRVGMRCIAVRTGGFGDQRLHAGGATEIADDPRGLVGRL